MQHTSDNAPSKVYPFRTRRQIAMLIQGNREFARECVEIMVARQLAKQAGKNATGAMGWGSSDASRIAATTQRIVDGVDTDGDWEEVLPVLARYTKQLAQHWRDAQLEAHPELADVAALFGVSLAARESSGTSSTEHAGPVLAVTEAEPSGAIDAPTAPVLLGDAVDPEAVPNSSLVDTDTCEAVPHASPDGIAPLASLPPLGSVKTVTSEASPQLSPDERAPDCGCVVPVPLVEAAPFDSGLHVGPADAVTCEAVAPVPLFEAITSEPVAPQLSPVQRAIIAYLTRHERGTTTEIAEQTRRDRAAVLEALRQLHEQGTIVRAGIGRGTFYSLRPQ